MLVFYAIYLPTFAAFLWSLAVSAINNKNFDVAIKICIIATIFINFGFMWLTYYVGAEIQTWAQIVRSIAGILFVPTVYTYVCYKFGVRYIRILPWLMAQGLLLLAFTGTFVYGEDPDIYSIANYDVIPGHWNLVIDNKLYGPYPVMNVVMLLQTMICFVRMFFLYIKMKKKRLHLSKNFYWFLIWVAALLFAVLFLVSRPHTFWTPDSIFWFMIYGSFIGLTGFSLLALRFDEEPALTSDNAHMMLEMPEEQLYELAKSFKEIVENDKLFMKPDLDLAYIARELNVPQSHISYMLDTLYDMPLATYIAVLRVGEVRKVISTKPDINPEVLPMLCGFLSLDELNKTFFQYTGVTPQQYAANVKNGED